MKKALLLGLCLSVAGASFEANADVWNDWMNKLSPARTYFFAAGGAAVGLYCGAIALEVFGSKVTRDCREWCFGAKDALRDAEELLKRPVGGIVLEELTTQTNNDPVKAAAVMYQYYNVTENVGGGEFRGFGVLQAVYKLGDVADDLARVESNLKKYATKLWKSSSKKKFNEIAVRLAETQKFVCQVANIMKQSDVYKQQLEQFEVKNRQELEDTIRRDQAHAERKIIIHQDGHREGVAVRVN